MSRLRLVSTLVTFLCALALAGVATAAAPAKADKHDRALIKKLLAFASSDDSLPTEEEFGALAGACPVWQQATEDQSLELIVALILPAILRMFDEQETEFERFGRQIGAMRPHARVFKEWIVAKRRETANALQFVQGFDSSRMDVCGYLDAFVAAGDVEDAIDIAFEKLITTPDDIAALVAYADAEEGAEAGRKKANARFAAFLRRSGYNAGQISALTG